MLDGLDEVPNNNVNQVIEHIEDFAIQHDKNTFVASCRTAAYRSSFQQFSDVTIADFDDDQIQQFIQRWFSSNLDQEADTANEYWQLLQQPENNAAKELAQTPLLLTFLCLIYEREQTLPNRRSTLYGRALTILLSEWSAQKRLPKTSIYKDFHPELEKELLSEIAYNSFKEDRLFFSKSDITDRITTYLADTLDAPKYLDGPDVLHAIEVQQGILVERATDTYSFSHLTLQEYLTALYIVHNQLVPELVSQHLTDQRWREVFLLVIGLMGRRGNELLEAIDKQARTDISTRFKPSALVQWAGRVTQGDTLEYKGYEKIAIAIAAAIAIARTRVFVASKSDKARALFSDVIDSNSTIAIAINSSKELAEGVIFGGFGASVFSVDNNGQLNIEDVVEDIDTIIAIAIDRTKKSAAYLNTSKIFDISAFQELPSKLDILKDTTPQSSASPEQWYSYTIELEKTFLNVLDLTTESISLSEKEWQCLSDYLYANDLLLQCKRSSIGISRKAWESLKERLLTV